MPSIEQTITPNTRLRARAANSNQTGRFERHEKVVTHDGWDLPEEEILLRTEVTIEHPRKVISRNTSPDIGFDRSINPYRGCEHGCIYCFARPTHAFLGLSPGLDFETKLVARPEAAKVLRKELSNPNYQVAPIAIGTNTDPYQPLEAQHRIMRQILETLSEFNHPVTIVTKGTLIERDIDILAPMAERGVVRVGVSITTLDGQLSRRMEPRVPMPMRRIATIRKLSEAGIPVRIMAAPMIPALNDHELENVLSVAKNAGAQAAEWIMLRLPLEVSPLFQDWLSQHYPDRAARIMGHVRAMHDGADYSAEWGARMKGSGVYADLVANRFQVAIKRLGLNDRVPKLRCDLFAVPGRAQQLSLF